MKATALKGLFMKKRASAFLVSLFAAIGVISFGAVSQSKVSEVEEVKATYNQTVNAYYSSINWDQTGATLKTALFNKIKITTAGWSYDGLWDAYKTTDVRPDGTHLWDIYSDTTDYTLTDNRINASYSKEGDSINREHVIPQSSFNKAAPMKSDIHHVLPSDGYVNNRRSAYPHGNVTGSVTYTSNDGCKLGSGGGSLGTVFEPMDNYKGDIARIYFYFVTCYQDKMSSNSFSAFDKSTYPSIDSKYLSTYLQWAKDDPVSQKEIDRNNAAYAGQGNRNPFVDCPYAVGAIWDSTHASDYGVKGQYTSGEGVSISKTSAKLISGGTTTISATSTNSGSVSWSTSNSSIVSLSETQSSSGSNITLTAGSAGSATITASVTISGNVYSQTCSVTVSATKQVSSISISGQKTSYSVDDTFVKPTVIAAYNDETQATVTNDATCTGYNMSVAGNYTVTVSYSYGGATKTASYEITVSASGGGGSGDIEGDYNSYSGTITEGNYVIVYDGKAVKNTISSSRLGYSTVTISNSKITDPDETIVWHIAADGNYWTLYNAAVEQYAASNGTKNQAALQSSNDDKTQWTVSGTSTYEFVNKYNSANSVNANLRENGTYGFACYSTSTGGALSLYKQEVQKTLTSISVSTNPTKTEYTEGETFVPTGLVITRTYSDSSSDTYAYAGHTTEFTFDPSLSTPLTEDDDSVEITYGGQSCFLIIDVSPARELDSIGISGYTTSFTEGDAFSFGGNVIANYAGGDSENVTSSATFTGYNMASVGNQTVTVSYTESGATKTQTYQITVSAGTLSSIAVSGQTTSYTKNAAFSFDGTCTATFANGYQKVVTPTSVTSPDMSTTGNKTITISYTYNGNTRTASYQISVSSYRTVMEASTLEGTITWYSATATISGDVTGLSAATSGRTQYENESMRLGTGSGGGTLSISASISIKSLTVRAKYYSSSYSSSVLKVDGTSVGSLTSSYKDYSVTLSSAKTSFNILTESSSSRVNIESVTIYAIGPETDIGQSEDCVGLENFINTYMHMDYTENLGYCSDSTHHYYSTAKTAFNALNTHQRSLFTGNSAYSAEWTRLSTWASKNGDSLNSSNILALGVKSPLLTNISSNSGTLIIVIAALSLTSLAIGGYFLLRKKKED